MVCRSDAGNKYMILFLLGKNYAPRKYAAYSHSPIRTREILMSINLFARKEAALLMVCLLGVSGTSMEGRSAQKEIPGQIFHWDRILSAYDAYIEDPSQENAKGLIGALPSDRPREISGNAESALRHIFSIDDYPVLLEEAISGVREAVEVLFRFINITDGLYLENVESQLGLILRNHPRLFLELLNNHKDIKHIRTWGYPVDFIGAGHNMHRKAALNTLEKRIEALETVEDSDLRILRDACLVQLRRTIKRVWQDDSIIGSS